MWRVRTHITGGAGGDGLSTMYFDGTGGLTAANAAVAVHTFWQTLQNHISNNLALQVDPLVYDINEATGHPVGVTSVSVAAVPGNASTDEAPWSAQGLIEWHTGNFLNGREIQGKTFIPGVTIGDNVVGAPGSGYVTALTAAGAALVADVNTSFQVYSRRNSAGIQVTAAAGWNKWAVLRSRRD